MILYFYYIWLKNKKTKIQLLFIDHFKESLLIGAYLNNVFVKMKNNVLAILTLFGVYKTPTSVFTSNCKLRVY